MKVLQRTHWSKQMIVQQPSEQGSLASTSNFCSSMSPDCAQVWNIVPISCSLHLEIVRRKRVEEAIQLKPSSFSFDRLVKKGNGSVQVQYRTAEGGTKDRSVKKKEEDVIMRTVFPTGLGEERGTNPPELWTTSVLLLLQSWCSHVATSVCHLSVLDSQTIQHSVRQICDEQDDVTYESPPCIPEIQPLKLLSRNQALREHHSPGHTGEIWEFETKPN